MTLDTQTSEWFPSATQTPQSRRGSIFFQIQLLSFTSYGNTCCRLSCLKFLFPHFATRVHFPASLPSSCPAPYHPANHLIHNSPYFGQPQASLLKCFLRQVSDFQCFCLKTPSPFKKIAVGITLQHSLCDLVGPSRPVRTQLCFSNNGDPSEIRRKIECQTPQDTVFNPGIERQIACFLDTPDMKLIVNDGTSGKCR